MRNIIIIGGGQIGSRHLQALSKLDFDVSIEIVEPNENSIELCKNRFAECDNNPFIKHISYIPALNNLTGKADLCIIATGADVRLTVFNEITNSIIVNNFLLEKILFQSLDDYYIAEDIINTKGLNVFVNCQRRMYLINHEIKKLLKDSQKINYKYHGSNWGLACNAIHFIDQVAYLTGITDYEMETTYIDNKILDSHRPGYKEITGTLKAKFKNGSNLELVSLDSKNTECKLNIESDKYQITINEDTNEAYLYDKSMNCKKKLEYETPYQSNLTNYAAKNIIMNSVCDLPDYSESMKLHLPFIKSLLEFFNKNTGKNELTIPIT